MFITVFLSDTYAEEYENNEDAFNGKTNGYLEKLEVNKYPKNLTFKGKYFCCTQLSESVMFIGCRN